MDNLYRTAQMLKPPKQAAVLSSDYVCCQRLLKGCLMRRGTHKTIFYEGEFNFGTNILFELRVCFAFCCCCLFVFSVIKLSSPLITVAVRNSRGSKSITISCFPVSILIMLPIYEKVNKKTTTVNRLLTVQQQLQS